MYNASTLNADDLVTLYYEGVLKDLYVNSAEYIDRGTYAYPGLDYTPEQIASASVVLCTNRARALCSYTIYAYMMYAYIMPAPTCT